MTQKKAPRTKSQTLSLRLDPKSRFILEFISKIRRRSITTIVEDAIKLAGKNESISPFEEPARRWNNYWDIAEGVRAMRMLADRDIPSSFEDDEVRAFIEHHIEFFSDTNELDNPSRVKLDVLWPNIDRFIDLWRDTKRTDIWSVGEHMVATLEQARVPAPKWPRETTDPPPPVKPTTDFSAELDDEIPF